MMQRTLAGPAALMAALALACSSASAEIRVYTDATAFSQAVTAMGSDNFLAVPQGEAAANPMTRRTLYGAEYLYRVTASTGSLVGVGTSDDIWLSTDASTDTMTFSHFSAGVSAFGGNFFGSDFNGLFAPGSVTLSVTDALGATTARTLNATSVTGFLGFVSLGAPIAEVGLWSEAMANGDSLWPTARQVILAQAAVSAVPEPAISALLLMGAGLMVRRVRAAKV